MNDTPWRVESTSLHHYIRTARGREVAAVIRPIHDLHKDRSELERTQAYQDAKRIVDTVNAAGVDVPFGPDIPLPHPDIVAMDRARASGVDAPREGQQ